MQVNPDSSPWGQIFAIYQKSIQKEHAKELLRLYICTLSKFANHKITRFQDDFDMETYCDSGTELKNMLVNSFCFDSRNVMFECIHILEKEGIWEDICCNRRTIFRVLCHIAGGCILASGGYYKNENFHPVQGLPTESSEEWKAAFSRLGYHPNTNNKDLMTTEYQIFLGYTGELKKITAPAECPSFKVKFAYDRHVSWSAFMSNRFALAISIDRFK